MHPHLFCFTPCKAKNNQILDDEDYNMEVQYSQLSKQSAILSGNGFLLANSFSQSQPS